MTNGLDDVVAAETSLSDVDGLGGHLVIRGYGVGTLAADWRFEDVAHLLLDGLFADLPPPAAFARQLATARQAVSAYVRTPVPPGLGPLETMRWWLAALPDGDGLDTALQLIAAPAVFTAAAIRLAHGAQPIAPDTETGHAADMLRMLGHSADPAAARALDAYLTTVIDHGMNASTFAARVVASTHAGLTSAVLAGLSALKGPLHGGAPGPVIAMLDAIGTAERAETWLEAALDRGDRLMGFGHRIYRVRDPRADALRTALAELSSRDGDRRNRLRLAEAVEHAALAALHRRKPDRRLEVNVEFYTALLLEAVGFPPDAFTCVFAASRATGWVAHAREQVLHGRLIRPQSVYIGPRPKAAA